VLVTSYVFDESGLVVSHQQIKAADAQTYHRHFIFSAIYKALCQGWAIFLHEGQAQKFAKSKGHRIVHILNFILIKQFVIKPILR